MQLFPGHKSIRRAAIFGTLVTLTGFVPVAAFAETLQEALISAYNTNPGLMAERARLREVDESFVQARAQGRLTSSLSGSMGYTAVRLPNTNLLGQRTGGFTTIDTEPRSVQLQVIQPLYQGGRVRALKSQAKAGVLAAREGLRDAEQSLFLRVAATYSNVLRDEETAKIRRNNVRVLSRQLQAATDRFEVGEGTRTDIAQAETRLAAADIGLAQADAQLQISRSTYIRVVGHPPADLQPVPLFVIPETLDGATAIARDNNPQLLAAMLNERAAEAAIDVAKSSSRPTLSINGTLSSIDRQVGNIERADSAAITAQLSIPIFSGGLNRSRVRAAGHARTRSMFETRDTERALDEAVAQIWAQLDSANRSLVSSRAQVKSAEFAFEGVQLEQQLGTRSMLDVLNAEQELLNAKLTVVNAEAAVQSTEFQLLAAMGAFDAQSIQLPVRYYDPVQNFESVKYLGLDKNIDTYVPIAMQKIGAQLPNIPKDVVRFTKTAVDIVPDDDSADDGVTTLLEIPHHVGVFVKETIDDVTGQAEKTSPQPIESSDN